MTKQHFIELARVVREHRDTLRNYLPPNQANEAADDLAVTLADMGEKFNPNFDRVRFMRAAGSPVSA